MLRYLKVIVLLATIALLWGASVRADNDGQDDLDKATQAKLNARTLADLDEVLRLTESAIAKGLNEGNAQFARGLLAATLVERAGVRAAVMSTFAPTQDKAAELRKAALDDLEKAVKLDPRQVRAWLMIAEINRLPGGDRKRSDEALEQAIKLGDDDPEAKAKALLFRANLTESLEKKLPDLDEAVRLAPRDPVAVRTRGAVKADLGRLEEALADFDRAIELDPKHLATYEVKALVLGRLKRFDEALAVLEQLRQLNPDSVFPLMQKARIRAMQANLKEALAELDRALQIDPNNVPVLILRAALQEDPDKKLADLDRAVKAGPSNPVAWRTRGLYHADRGNFEAALGDLDKAIEAGPAEAVNYEAKAAVLARMNRFDDALAVLDKLRQLNPKSAYPLIQRAQLRIQQRNLKAAVEELDAALAIEPENPAILLLRAAVWQDLGQRDKAMADVQHVLKIAPEAPGALRLLASLLADEGKIDEAIEQLQKVREAEPKDLLTMLQLAVLYGQKKAYDKALELYGLVLAQDPDNWLALRGRGDLLLNTGKQAEAIADYEKAFKLRPKDPLLLNNLAWVLATSPDPKLRDGRRALELATTACELTEYKRPHILSTLGAAYAELGDFENAKKWSAKGLELAEDEEQKEHFKKELECYNARKPFRELLIDGKPAPLPPEKPGEEKPALPPAEKPAEK